MNFQQKVIRPEVLNKILEKYPEFYSDTGAFSILKDPVLLEKMFRSNQAKQIGEQYPILVNSAKFVAETLRSYIKKNPTNTQQSSGKNLQKKNLHFASGIENLFSFQLKIHPIHQPLKMILPKRHLTISEAA